VNENVEHGPNFLRSNGTDYLLVSVNDQDVGKTTGQVRMMNSVDGSWAEWSVDTPQLLSAPVLQGDIAFVTAVSWDGSLRGNHTLIAIDVAGMRVYACLHQCTFCVLALTRTHVTPSAWRLPLACARADAARARSFRRHRAQHRDYPSVLPRALA
jgi:hypothetical protein